jgi:outer membrane protein assembly factor BamA
MEFITVTHQLKLFFKVLCVFGVFSLSSAQELQLKIISKDSIETNLINSIGYIKTFSNFNDLQTEVALFKDQLYQRGYIEAQILEISQTPSLITAELSFGPKYDSIQLYASKSDFKLLEIKEVINIESNPYYVAEIVNLEILLNSLTELLAAKSYPFASISLKMITPINGSTLRADLVVETKQARQLQSVEIKGYEKFPRSFIRHYLGIKPNTPFNLKAIRSKTEALNQLRFTKQIRPAEVLFTQDTTRVYLYLEKLKSNRFDGFLGFGSDENSGDLELNGYLNLNLINNLNFGESFRLNYRSDENDLKTFETQLTLPYLFKTPVGSELELNIFKKDSTFTTAEQAASVYYQINPKQKVFLGVRSTQSNALLPETINNVSDYKTNAYELKYTYQQINLQNLLFPLNSALEFRLSKSTRKTMNIKTNQLLFLLKASNIFNLNQKNSFYAKLHIQGINSDTYLLNELIRFGGINNLRGFEENSINASKLGVLASEYRYQLSPTLYVHSIIDAGYFESPTVSNQKLYGFGFGFGLLTDAGLLKFNLANGQTEHQNFKFSDSKIHLSLSATF